MSECFEEEEEEEGGTRRRRRSSGCSTKNNTPHVNVGNKIGKEGGIGRCKGGLRWQFKAIWQPAPSLMYSHNLKRVAGGRGPWERWKRWRR